MRVHALFVLSLMTSLMMLLVTHTARADDLETMIFNLRTARTADAFESLAQRYFVDDIDNARRAFRKALPSYVRLRPELPKALIWLHRLDTEDKAHNNELALQLAPLCRTPDQWKTLFSHPFTTLDAITGEDGRLEGISVAHGLVQRALGSCGTLRELARVVESNPAVASLAGTLVRAFLTRGIERGAADFLLRSKQSDIEWALEQYRGAGSVPDQLLDRAASVVRSARSAIEIANRVARIGGSEAWLGRFVARTLTEAPTLRAVNSFLEERRPVEDSVARAIVTASLHRHHGFLEGETRFGDIQQILRRFDEANAPPHILFERMAALARSGTEMAIVLENVRLIHGEALEGRFLTAVLPRLIEVTGDDYARLAWFLRVPKNSPETREALLRRMVDVAFASGPPQLDPRIRDLLGRMSESERSHFIGEKVRSLATGTAQSLDTNTRYERLRALLSALDRAGLDDKEVTSFLSRALRLQTTGREYEEAIGCLNKADSASPKMTSWLHAAALATLPDFLKYATVDEVNRLVWDSGLFASSAQKELVLANILQQHTSLQDMSGLRLPAYWFRSREFQAILRNTRREGGLPQPNLFSCFTTMGGFI